MNKRTTRLSTGPLAAALLFQCSGLNAQTFNLGDAYGYFNLELAYGLRVRMEDQNKNLIGPGNVEGGTFHLNSDDGNLNYDDGDIVANVFSLKPELALNWGRWGIFARGYAFYDIENSDHSRDHVPLSDEARDDVAHDSDLQEAYLSVEFMTGDMPTRLRIGKQVMNWGQATFFPGIASVNPVNLPQLTMPGGGNSDLYQGQGMAWGLIALTPLVSVEGYYVYDWEPSNVVSSGAYLAAYDNFESASSYGGANSYLVGESNDTGPADTLATVGLAVPDGACEAMNGGTGPTTFTCETEAFGAIPGVSPRRPEDNDGDWGLSIRTVIPQLNDTELGLHYAEYTPHFLISGVQMGNFPEIAESGYTDPQFGNQMLSAYTPDGLAQISDELRQNDLCSKRDCDSAASIMSLHWALRTAELQPYYPDDRVNMFGISFATTTPITGTGVAGELVHRKDMPIQAHSGEVLWGAANPTVSSPDCNDGRTVRIGPVPVPCAPLEWRSAPYDNLLVELDTSQLTLNATQLFPSGFLGSDTWTVGLEASWIHLHSMPDAAPNAAFCLTRPDNRASRDEVVSLAVPGTRIFQCDEASYNYVTDDSWGFRAFSAASWGGVFGAFTIVPRILYKQDVEGYSPYGQLIEGREELTVGLTTSFLRSLSVDISYRAFGGGRVNNLLRDRDYMDLVIKYEF